MLDQQVQCCDFIWWSIRKVQPICHVVDCISNCWPKSDDTQCGFRPGRSTTDQISLPSKFSRNLGSMPKTSTHVLSTSRKHSSWKAVGSVDGRLLLAVKSLYSCSEVCVRVGGVKSQPFTVGVGLWRQGCVLSAILFIVCTVTAESTRVSLFGAAGSTVCFWRTIWCCLHLFTWPPAFTWSVSCYVRPNRNEEQHWKDQGIMSLRWKGRGIMSLQKPKPVYVASKQQCTAAGAEVQVYCGGIHEWRKAEQGDWYADI